ncbi:chemotaxis protein CheD [Caldalkalibacillus mannanilyticus]|uniref:chemotaxis protein CheD n=1 Tax=Caldalkalibacillus mannanilyticus TaxID=1418 RepID=UPI00046820E2|nr:chemotaxis protein CheD [Caldalkalibacillus mannanilyticus]
MSNIIKVGMADLNVALAPDRLRTSGLGSCVGLTLFDPTSKVAGLAHVMLPSSELSKQGELNEAKYADTAIPLLIQKMKELGANTRKLQSKMAGGAQMFVFQSTNDSMRIGPRNVEACKEMLQKFNIPLLAEDTGGNCGRTIEFITESGLLNIRTVNQGVKEV